jgi:hypothetical protein
MAMTNTLATTLYNMRKRSKSRRFAEALTVHKAGLTVIGTDQTNGNYAAAMFVASEIDGAPWVCIGSGVTGATPLSGFGVVNDGGAIFQSWAGNILSAPLTPA